MTEHIERNIKSRQQRTRSRRAQLRQLQKALKVCQDALDLSIHRNILIHKHLDDAHKKISELQERIPFWRKKT